MCWNAQVSLQTFVIGSIIMCIAYAINISLFEIAFVFCILLIQLLEYFIWTHMQDKNKDTLKFYSFLTYIVILLQPVILFYFTDYKWYIPIYISLQCLLLLVFLIFFDIQYDFVPIVATNGHLDWNWSRNKMYIRLLYSIYVPSLIAASYLCGNIWIFILTIITYVISIYYHMNYGSIGSMWCWSANIAIYIIFIQYIWKKRKYIKNLLLDKNKKMNRH